MNKKNKIEIGLKSLTLLGSAVAFLLTIMTWQQQNDIKRAEFLEQRIVDFEDPSMHIAKRILDGFAICDSCNAKKTTVSDEEMIFIGSSREGVNTDIQLSNLDKALIDEAQTSDFSKQRVRLSFDKLLDFFSKLEYYLELELMTIAEVNYFRYYIEKSFDSNAIMTYAKQNNFDLVMTMYNSGAFKCKRR